MFPVIKKLNLSYIIFYDDIYTLCVQTYCPFLVFVWHRQEQNSSTFRGRSKLSSCRVFYTDVFTSLSYVYVCVETFDISKLQYIYNIMYISKRRFAAFT